MMTTEEIKPYYFALYARATIEMEDNDDSEEEYEDTKFYEKRFYCAHFTIETYEKYCTDDDAEKLALFAIDEYEESTDFKIGEWIEDLHDSIVVGITFNEETDVNLLFGDKEYGYETGMVKFATWLKDYEK